MKKFNFLLILFFFQYCLAFSQFKPNSTGVCYLTQSSSKYYNLEIILPSQTLLKQRNVSGSEFQAIIDSFNYAGTIVFFDSLGELARIKGSYKFYIQFWCENDGGIQYRAARRIQIRKSAFKRLLRGIVDIQNICCFVIVNQNGQKLMPPPKVSDGEVEITGDINGDGIIDCLIWTAPNDAQNCDGEPNNNLTIKLRVENQDNNLRCCGP